MGPQLGALYELEDEYGNLLVWFTGSTKTVLQEGATYALRANVKAHQAVHGVR